MTKFPNAPAQAREASGAPAVNVGGVGLGTPVMLAPMAGVTNPPFRQLCREFGEAAARDVAAESAGTAKGTQGLANVDGQASGGAAQSSSDENTPASPSATQSPAGFFAPTGLYVCEMITSRALVEQTPETMRMIQPDLGDPLRSIQLYGVEPKTIGESVRMLVGNGWARHIDLNFGCPVPKVTRKGGGAALPWKHDLTRAILSSAVQAANEESGGTVPVTAKFRIGIDDEHVTFRDMARFSADAGISALTLHARTLTQNYSGTARWETIGELVSLSELPVFGNGDVFEADDALAMMKQTGAAGAVVGRGGQGRPWLFYDLVAALAGSDRRLRPSLRQVADIIIRHAELSIEHFGDERRAMREMRKHVGWYLRGFSVGGTLRHDLALVSSLDELRQLLDGIPDQPYPQAASGPRGRAGGAKRPHLPDGWLDSHLLNAEHRQKIHEAEIGVSGG